MKIGLPTSPRVRCLLHNLSEDHTYDHSTLKALFADANYDLLVPGTENKADIVLIDLRARLSSLNKTTKKLQTVRARSPEASFIFLIDNACDISIRHALRRLGELVVTGDDYRHIVARIRQIVRLRNIAEETGERLKTLATMNRLGEFPPILTSNAAANVLIAGPPGPAALAIAGSCRDAVKQCISVFSPGQAMRALDHDNFDAAIFIAESDNDPMMSLVRALRRHPKHGDIPILCVSDEADFSALLAARGGQDFIHERFIGEDIRARLQLVVRRGRLMRSMRTFLKACVGDGVKDNASRAFTSAFLNEHGARLCMRADQTGRPLGIAAIRMQPLSDHSSNLPGDAALQKAASLLTRITRAEDFVARISADTFMIAMPATAQSDAQNVAKRIVGVVENTVFRDEEAGTLFSAHVTSTAFERPASLIIEEVVAHAVKQLIALDAIAPQRDSVTASLLQFPQ